MQSLRSVTVGIVILVLSILATGCIVAPYGGGREGGGYDHERREDRGEHRMDRHHDLRGETRD